MKNVSGSNIIRVKSHNRQAILLRLLDAPLSRVELADRLSLSSMTVTNLVNELLADGLIEQSCAVTNGRRSVGRPRQTLQLKGGAVFAIGVHIGVGYLHVGLVDLTGQLVDKRRSHFDTAAPPTTVLQHVHSEIGALIEAHPNTADRVVGVGVGSPGLVDVQRGECVAAPSLGWQRVDLAGWLGERTGLPVTVENNVRAMALGEAYFGVEREVDSLAFVYGRNGVGAGFVMERQLFRGIRAGAGEIGHTIILPDSGDPCRCGQTGCLETLIAQPVLEHKLAVRLDAPRLPDTTLPDVMRFERILQHGRSGNVAVNEVLRENGRYLSIALINLVNTLNPERIILGGMFWQGADVFLPIVRQTVCERAFANLGEHVTIDAASFGLDAGVIGAAALGLVQLFFLSNL